MHPLTALKFIFKFNVPLTFASLGRNDEAVAALEKALELGLPPVLLAPLHWLEQDKVDFYQQYAKPILARYG